MHDAGVLQLPLLLVHVSLEDKGRDNQIVIKGSYDYWLFERISFIKYAASDKSLVEKDLET